MVVEHGRKTLPNRFKSMRVHVGLAIFYGLIGLALVAALLFTSQARWDYRVVSGLVTVVCFAVAHGWIAIGARKANSMAQVASVIAGIIMLAAFPIGTLIGVYLLANANWSGTELDEGSQKNSTAGA